MGIIYNKQTATCLLEFQAAYRHWDLSPSIFTFQLWLNKHDKYTLTHTHGSSRPHFNTALSPPFRRHGLYAEVVGWSSSPGTWQRAREGLWVGFMLRMSVLPITGACRSVCVCGASVRVCVRTADRKRDRDRDPGKCSHGSEAQARNTNIFACATAGAAFDISTAVNYELACREVDRAVNMQNEEERPGPVQHTRVNSHPVPAAAGNVNHSVWLRTWVGKLPRISQRTSVLRCQIKKILYTLRRKG